MSDLDPYTEPPDFERLCFHLEDRHVIVSPVGLEYAFSPDPDVDRVSIEQLQAACARYSARKTTVAGSYAHRHYVETGHVFGFGCCLGTER